MAIEIKRSIFGLVVRKTEVKPETSYVFTVEDVPRKHRTIVILEALSPEAMQVTSLNPEEPFRRIVLQGHRINEANLPSKLPFVKNVFNYVPPQNGNTNGQHK